MEEQEYHDFILDDTRYKTKLTQKYRNQQNWEAEDVRKIKAMIPGTVLQLHVKPGQSVKKGEVLMIYKAMKMNNRVQAPMDGKIKTVHVKKDQNFPKNTLLLELE